MLQCILKSNPRSKFMFVVDTRPKVSNCVLWIPIFFYPAPPPLHCPPYTGSLGTACGSNLKQCSIYFHEPRLFSYWIMVMVVLLAVHTVIQLMKFVYASTFSIIGVIFDWKSLKVPHSLTLINFTSHFLTTNRPGSLALEVNFPGTYHFCYVSDSENLTSSKEKLEIASFSKLT